MTKPTKQKNYKQNQTAPKSQAIPSSTKSPGQGAKTLSPPAQKAPDGAPRHYPLRLEKPARGVKNIIPSGSKSPGWGAKTLSPTAQKAPDGAPRTLSLGETQGPVSDTHPSDPGGIELPRIRIRMNSKGRNETFRPSLRRRLPTLPLSPSYNKVIGVIRLDFSVRPITASEEVEPAVSFM